MPPTRILFVCMGNICRSPAAENVFRQQAMDAGRDREFEIDSAGTIAYHEGSPPDQRMTEALKRAGFASTGTARCILPQDLADFDLVVTMDESNYSEVLLLDEAGLHHAKVRPFVSFCRVHDDLRVPDPYYGGQRGFDHVISLLKDGCSGILDHFPKP